MAATEAVLGYQSILSRENTAVSPPVFVAVAEVRKISNVGVKRGLVEVTHMESPEATKEYIGTLKDGVEISVMCNCLMDATQTGLIDDVDSGVARNFTLDLAEETASSPSTALAQITFTALVLGWEISPDPNAPLEITFTMKITGPVEIT